MIIAITGASGFIGTRLTETLLQAGHSVRPLPRSPQPSDLHGADAIVHLAGEAVAQRWTAEAKHGSIPAASTAPAPSSHSLSVLSPARKRWSALPPSVSMVRAATKS